MMEIRFMNATYVVHLCGITRGLVSTESQNTSIHYMLYGRELKIQLPILQEPPDFLQTLLTAMMILANISKK